MMSGGEFDYKQRHIFDISDHILECIENAGDRTKYYFSQEIIDEFQKAVKLLRKAYFYTQYIDKLISGDDSEETFLENIRELEKEDAG